jgi:hypothetical protein
MPTSLVSNRPLDLSGQSVHNLVVDEPHDLGSRKIRSIAPKQGPYYTESLQVWDAVTNSQLTRHVDYKCIDIVGLPSAHSGKEICSLIVVTNSQASSQVRLVYQALGGDYARSYEPIRSLVGKLSEDTRKVEWGSLLDRPVYFDPAQHLHSAGDVIGFEYLVAALESLKNAVLLGDQVDHDLIRQYLDNHIESLRRLMDDAENAAGVMALATAQSANSMAVTALNVANSTQTYATQVERLVNTASGRAQDLSLLSERTEADARRLLNSYPMLFRIQTNTDLNVTPAVGLEHPLVFDIPPEINTFNSDAYVIDGDGAVRMGDGALYEVDQGVFSVVVRSSYDGLSSVGILELTIKSQDLRGADFVGGFCRDCEVMVYPPKIDDGRGNYLPTFCHTVMLDCREAPRDGVIRGISYGVVGVDVGTEHSLQGGAVEMQNNARRIADFLMDNRVDYNVANYGTVTKRRAVKMRLPVGSEVKFSFLLSGLSLEEIEQTIHVAFIQSVSVMVQNNASPTSIELVRENPDAGRVRSVSCHY